MKTITLAGQSFQISALPIIGLKVVGPRLHFIESIGTGDWSPEAVDALVDGVWYGVKRNHPEVTREFIENNIDIHNMKAVLDAFAEVNTAPKSRGASSGKSQARK